MAVQRVIGEGLSSHILDDVCIPLSKGSMVFNLGHSNHGLQVATSYDIVVVGSKLARVLSPVLTVVHTCAIFGWLPHSISTPLQ